MLPTARSVLFYPTVATYRADTTAWLAAASGSYSTADRTALDNYLAALSSNGLLSFDRLWLYHFADNAADSHRCIVSLQTSVVVGTPVFTKRQGWRFSVAAATYINTNWAPSAGVQYKLNDSSLSIYCRALTGATTATRIVAGCVQASSANGLAIGASANNTTSISRINISSAATASAAVLPSSGSYLSASRLSSTAYAARKGATEETLTVSSSGLCNANMFVGGRNSNGTRDAQTDSEESLIAVGAGQTFSQWTTFQSLTNTFHTAIGFS